MASFDWGAAIGGISNLGSGIAGAVATNKQGKNAVELAKINSLTATQQATQQQKTLKLAVIGGIVIVAIIVISKAIIGK
jgi:hypothetical protein